MTVVAGTPAVDIPSAVRKIGLPFRSAPKMMALRLSRSLIRERTDDIASVVASGPSDVGAHETGGVAAIAAEPELQTPIASAQAIANERILRKPDIRRGATILSMPYFCRPISIAMLSVGLGLGRVA
jgi:hypothetical protein